jgi:type I restriction enzyme S subunit
MSAEKKLPAGWEVKKLGEVCDLINRGISPKYLETGGIQVVNQKCIRNHIVSFELARIHDNNAKTVSPERYLMKGDVLVNSTGTGTLGRVAQIKEELEQPVTVDSHVSIVRPTKNCFDFDFFGYALCSIEEDIQLAGDGCGGQIELSRKTLAEEFSINFPKSISEQKRIVAILDEAFQSIDKAKENAQKNLANARKILEGYLNQVFANPGKDWEEKKLGEICTVSYGHTEKAKKTGQYRFVRITDTDDEGLLTNTERMYVDSFDGISDYLLSDGDILMARVGASAGNVLLFTGTEKAVFASFLIRLVFKCAISTKLYWFFTKTKRYWDQVNSLSVGSAQPQFNGGAVKQIVFAFPVSEKEQNQIIAKAETLLLEVKHLESIYTKKLVALDELKKSILQKAFSGEL